MVAALWMLWVGLSLAADPPAEPTEVPEPLDDPAVVEVIVFGELLVEQAKLEVYTDLKDAGYTDQIRKDDHTIFRHEDPYKGEVHVYDDGWIRVKRQKLRIEGREMPWADRNSPLAWAGCVVWLPLCIRPAGQTLSHRRFQGYETRVVSQVQPDVGEWAERIADLAVSEKVQKLPYRLDMLWADGRPLEGEGGSLTTYAERRQAILHYWEHRTDTPWGEAVRDAIESFCRGVVQGGDHPFTDREIAAFNAQSTAARPFSLERRQAVMP